MAGGSARTASSLKLPRTSGAFGERPKAARTTIASPGGELTNTLALSGPTVAGSIAIDDVGSDAGIQFDISNWDIREPSSHTSGIAHDRDGSGRGRVGGLSIV